MRIWTAELAEGEPTALEHLALRWLPIDHLYDVEWLPGDLPVVAAIRRYLKATDKGAFPGTVE
jgi:8-oxo-dGTP diphosphatase